MSPPPVCFCVAGWHFPESVYAALNGAGHVVFIVSHRPPASVPASIARLIPPRRIFYEPNLGYDWGCYQQFLTRGLWRSYETIFFMHDDLQIGSMDFITHSLELIQSGAQVVGNAPNSSHVAWPTTHLACYAHSGWLPPATTFEHPTVRGSFFAITSHAIEKLGRFEVFWDPKQVYMRFGNHSLIATCGKLFAIFGEGSFAFLGADYRHSPYIQEDERGGQSRTSPTLRQRLAVNFYKVIGRTYVSRRMQALEGKTWTRRLGGLLQRLDGVERSASFYRS